MAEIIGAETETRGKLKAIASGTLSNGDTVVVNSDGTVSKVAGTSVSSSIGSATSIDSNPNKYDMTAGFDSNAGKVVLFYRDGNNSGYGTAVVGTVSGTTISFGTPVVFVSEVAECRSATFDSGQNSIIITYQDGSNHGACSVGQVSGTSITFGSKVKFNAGITYNISSAYDTVNQKIVVAYRDSSASRGNACVGTVSGTTISFGSEYSFYNGNVSETATTYDVSAGKIVIFYKDASSIGKGVVATVSGTALSYGTEVQFTSNNTFYYSAAYNSAANKHLLVYQDGNASNIGKGIVASVSGTTISFGTEAAFSGANTVYWITAAYDEDAELITVSYRDATNSNYGTYVNGTISGTSITFSTPTVFINAWVQPPSNVYDTTNNKMVISYRNVTNSSANGAIVLQNAYTSTNITAENFIGISSTTVADAETATIDIIGTTNNAQSGLTAGQKYYVQNDGTLSTTAGDPSVLAGTALSATKIVVKT